MNMKSARVAIAVLVAGLACAAHAQNKPCTPADAKNAAKNVDLVMTWPQLQKAVKDYGHCDTGSIADVFTDTLMRLAVDWKHVDALAGAMKDDQFRAFVATHLKSDAAADDRQAVYSRATMSCPKGQDEVCAELAGIIKGPKEAPQAPPKEAPKDPAKK
jgi:hypothetical protein